MKKRRGDIARYDIVRRLATGLLLFAFVLQGYLSQSHFHRLAAAASQTALALAATEADVPPTDRPANLPDHHNDKCFVCHLTGLGSLSVQPPALVQRGLLPTAWIFTNRGDHVIAARWLSDHAPRGPPTFVIQA